MKDLIENRIRRLVQLASLYFIGEFSFYGIFRCPFAVPYVSCGNCPVIQCPGRSLWMWVWILIGLSGLLFGRVFCAYACPGYLVSEFISHVSLTRDRVKVAVKRFLFLVRYVILASCLYFVFVRINPRWAVPIRTGEFFKSVALTFEHADHLWIARTVIVLSIVALGIVVPMVWCRFVCPTGGALELLSRISLFRYGMSHACTDCGQCAKRCPMETRPDETGCTNCGDCVPSCAPKAIVLQGVTIRKECD
jgi:polyferredoxin